MTDLQRFDKVYQLLYTQFIEKGINYFMELSKVDYSSKLSMIRMAKIFSERNDYYIEYAKQNNTNYRKDYVARYTIYNKNESEELLIYVSPYQDFKFFLIFEIIKYNLINDKYLIEKVLSDYENQNKANQEKKAKAKVAEPDIAQPQPKFKVGDEVSNTKGSRNFIIQDIVEFDKNEKAYVYSLLNLKSNKKEQWFENELVKTEQAPQPKFKVGDSVMIDEGVFEWKIVSIRLNRNKVFIYTCINDPGFNKSTAEFKEDELFPFKKWKKDEPAESPNKAFIMARAKAKLKLLALNF